MEKSKNQSKTILNFNQNPNFDYKHLKTKTTFLKSIPLINIEESLQNAEKLLKNERILEGLTQYEQIFTKFKVDLSPHEFELKFSENFLKIALIAINFLNNSKKDVCFSLLTRCEKILLEGLYGDFPEIKTLIFNHLGCYFRRIEKIDVALNYYEKALELVYMNDKRKNSGLTHMNLSAIYSQIQKYCERVLREFV